MATTAICGMLDWRPHIWLHGPAACGKTTASQVIAAVCEPMIIAKGGDSTEAGVRQFIKQDAIGVLLDDLDKEDPRQQKIRAILRLMRASSSGSGVLRGTADQGGTEFQVYSVFAL